MSHLRLRDVELNLGARNCLAGINLDLEAGQLMCLLGPNGAGKSSLIKLASGEWTADAGEVHLLGRPLARWSARERARCLAVLPQHSSLSFPFRAREVVGLGRIPHASGARADGELVERAMRALGVWSLADKPYPRLSGGERQRVQLARVLSQVWPQHDQCERGVLLLDEPTAGLDWAHRIELMVLLRQLADEGLAIMLVLHDLNLALGHADQVGVLHCGGLAALGPPQAVLTSELIAAVFSVQAVILPHPLTGRPVIV